MNRSQEQGQVHVCLFKLLQQCTDPITDEEAEALYINRGSQDKNRPGADIPGTEQTLCHIALHEHNQSSIVV